MKNELMNLVAKDLINTICLLTSYNKNDALILTQPNNLHFYFSYIDKFWKVYFYPKKEKSLGNYIFRHF